MPYQYLPLSRIKDSKYTRLLSFKYKVSPLVKMKFQAGRSDVFLIHAEIYENTVMLQMVYVDYAVQIMAHLMFVFLGIFDEDSSWPK